MSESWITEEIEENLGNKKKKRKINLKILIPIAALVLVAAIVSGIFIYKSIYTTDISPYGDQEVLITGVTDEDFTITPYDLLEMECIDVYTNGGTQKSAGVNGHGPTISTFLEHYGREITDYKKIRVTCADDYVVVLKREYITDDYDIVMSVRQLNKLLPKVQRPLRLIIPDGESGKWAYGITRIDFIE